MKKTLPLVLYVLYALTGGAGARVGGIVLSLTSAQAVDDGQSLLLTAFANQGGAKWSLTGPSALSAQTATSATYTAPASGTRTTTITATSTAGVFHGLYRLPRKERVFTATTEWRNPL